MANVNNPNGAVIIQTESASFTGKIHSYVVLASDATALYKNALVKTTGTLAVNEDGVYYPVVTQAGVGDTPRGIVVGFKNHPDYENQNYRSASTLRTVYVMDDPDVIFSMQTNGTAAAADAGANADIVVGTGSTVTGYSGMQIDQTTVATTNTLVIRILDMDRGVDNELGAYTRWRCKFNLHELTSTTGV